MSNETFYKFQKSAKDFLQNPSESFFVPQELDIVKLQTTAQKKGVEFVHVRIETGKQPGDIAGTKLKKFSEFLMSSIKPYFTITQHEFSYNDVQAADIYLLAKSKNEVVRIGPPLHMKKHVAAFKKEHANTFEKNKMVHAKINVNFTARSYLDIWAKSNAEQLRQMSITNFEIQG